MLGLGYLRELLINWGMDDVSARSLELWVGRPLAAALVCLIAWIVIRIGTRVIRSRVATRATQMALDVAGEASNRQVDTASRALVGVWSISVAVCAFLIALGVLGVQVFPLLAGAGVAGVAIGLGAQGLVRDVIGGLSVVLDSRYFIGDWVQVGEISGTVEDLNLRLTKIRGLDGTLWFVPNGEVRVQGNASRGFAQAVVDLPVRRQLASADDVLQLAKAAMSELETELANLGVLKESPVVLGVQDADKFTVGIRVVAKTEPGEQWEIEREIRRRLLSVLG